MYILALHYYAGFKIKKIYFVEYPLLSCPATTAEFILYTIIAAKQTFTWDLWWNINQYFWH